MRRMILLPSLAVFIAGICAISETAVASPVICETVAGSCESVKAPVAFHAQSTGSVKFVSGGTPLWECETGTLAGTLTTNNGTKFEADIESASFSGPEAGGKCKSSLVGPFLFDSNVGSGTPWCLSSTSTTADTWSIRGNSCTSASRSITFVLTTTNVGTCKYNRTAAAAGTFTTHMSSTEDAILTASPEAATEWTKEEGSVLCAGTVQLQWSFTFTTNDAAKTTLYIG